MSDNAIHIVPIHTGTYQNDKQKAEEILKWFQEREIIENTLSDCILSLDKNGYRFKPNITSIFKDGDLWAYSDSLKTHGLELVFDKRTIFHPVEGMYLEITCPHCKYQFSDDFGFTCITQWYENINDYPICPKCKQKRHLIKYHIEPEWAFSNIGITLWNTHWDFKTEFLEDMKQLFGSEITVVQARL
jgi:hypothetical protein